MSLFKSIDRLRRMDDLIRRKATGTPNEFAEKLGLSPSQLFLVLKEMKELGTPIQYCTVRKSYYYEVEGRLVIVDFVEEGQRIKGGKNIFGFFEYSDKIGVTTYTLALQSFES